MTQPTIYQPCDFAFADEMNLETRLQTRRGENVGNLIRVHLC